MSGLINMPGQSDMTGQGGVSAQTDAGPRVLAVAGVRSCPCHPGRGAVSG